MNEVQSDLPDESAARIHLPELPVIDPESSVPARLEAVAQRFPSRLAFKSQHCELTYRELIERVNAIAAFILNLVDSRGERIALILGNDAPMIAAMLACLKTGNTYVPLDSSQPRERSRYISKDSQSRLILTNDELCGFATEIADDAVTVVKLTDLPVGQRESGPPDISPDTPAWILYTSGSTGHPKGVVQNHRNILHFVKNYRDGLDISSGDRVALLFSCAVNAGAHQIYTALLSGAGLYGFDLQSNGLTGLADWLVDNEVTICSSVPTVFNQFIDPLRHGESFPSLRFIMMMGEPVYKRHVDGFKQHFKTPTVLVNRLGSTETGSIRWNFISPEVAVEDINVPVGYPVSGNEVLLLDEAGAEIGDGEIGEIAVRSRFLSPGYWNKPELTAAAFSPDPTDPDQQIFRTGDLGRMLPDGALQHMGRADFQLKIRGYRIEPAEVEAPLLRRPEIREAVAWKAQDNNGELRLVAYLVAEPGHRVPRVTELRAALARMLPEYMISSLFIELESLPLAPNGKLDYCSLPEPDSSRPDLDETYVAPRDEIEIGLTTIWEDILEVRPIGIRDKFLELGGDSIRAARLFAEINAQFDRELPLSAVFHAPDIERQAVLLRDSAVAAEASILVRIQPHGSATPLFGIHACSGEVLFYADLSQHLGGDQPFYNLRLQGIYGEEIPHAGIEDIAEHYIGEMLTMQAHGPYQLIGAGGGGRIAFEIAQQLLARCESVGLLCLLDSSPPSFVATNDGLIGRLGRVWAELCEHARAGRLPDLVTSAVKNRLVRLQKRLTSTMHGQRAQVAQAQLRKSSKRYRPNIFPGPIVYFSSETRRRKFSLDAWHFLAGGGLDVREVSGDHLGLLKEPHVGNVARQIKELITTDNVAPSGRSSCDFTGTDLSD